MTDEDQIRELQALWGQRHADRDAARWSELWIEGGKFINPRGGEVVGREALQAYFKDRYLSSERRTTHVFGLPVIRIEGDTAVSATDYLSSSRDGDGATVAGAIGRMFVRYVRQGGKWYFSEYRIVNHPDPLPSADR
jgi:ketosteroid isomerase-like protein